MFMQIVASLLVLQQESEGLTLGEILANIPTDPAALIVYFLLAFSVFVIWKYGRTPGGTGPSST